MAFFAFFAFFYVLYKSTWHSLRSFTFFIKECKRKFHKSYKNNKSCEKKNGKERSVLFIRLKKNLKFFFQYIFIYIYLYISIYCISIYINIYIYWKKEFSVLLSFAFFCKRIKRSRVLLRSLQKNETFSAFIYVLCKRMLYSLRSFGFHKSPKTQKKNTKEQCVL